LQSYDEKDANSNVLLVSGEIALPLIPHEVLSLILKEHEVSKEKVDLIEEIYKRKKHLLFKHLHDFELELILCKELILQLKTQTMLKHESLSELSDKAIYFSKKQILQLLNKWVELSKQHAHLNISVIPFNPHGILTTMNLYVFEGTLIFATELKNREYFIASESKLILRQIQKYLSELLMLYEEEESLESLMTLFNH
jgi:hypothetical protein